MLIHFIGSDHLEHLAEGSIWLAVTGTPESEEAAEKILQSVADEAMFSL